MYSDPSGCFVISASAIIIGAVIGAVVGLATTAVADYKEDKILFNGNNFDYLFNGLTGAITGAIGGIFANAGFALQLGVSAIIGAISNVSEGLYTLRTPSACRSRLRPRC